jgi:hypothetical protein
MHPQPGVPGLHGACNGREAAVCWGTFLKHFEGERRCRHTNRLGEVPARRGERTRC